MEPPSLKQIDTPEQADVPAISAVDAEAPVAILGARISRKVRRYFANSLWALFGELVLGISCAWYLQQRVRDGEWISLICNPFFGLGLIASFVVTSILLITVIRRRFAPMRNDVHTLAQKDDLRAIGSLIDVLGGVNAMGSRVPGHTVAQESLTRLLPRLRAGDEHLLDSRQRARLCFYLIPERGYPPQNGSMMSRLYPLLNGRRQSSFYLLRDVEFRLIILQAFEQVGGQEELQIVERLAKMNAPTPEHERIREAAQACLPILQARVSQTEASRVLLRPSGEASAESNALLRPASGTTEVSSELLLRASDAPSGDS